MKRSAYSSSCSCSHGIGGTVWWKGAHPAPAAEKATLNIVTVDRGTVRQVVNATGKISSNYDVDIKCKASGEVISLPFDVSDVVKKGELVLELDPIDEQRRVAQMESAKASADWRLIKTKLSLQVAEESLETDRKQAEINLNSAQIRYGI
jgi:HlyD family secretion protein